jgi:Family of unknown function (DUF6011)
MARFAPSTTAPVAPVAPVVTETVTTAPIKRNRYGAKCVTCKVYVEAEAGRLTNVRGEWVVSHIPPCPRDSETFEPGTNWPEPEVFSMPEGRYTIVFEDESYKTLKVTRQAENDDFMAGKQLVSYLSGSDNTSDYTNFAHVDATGTVKVWKKHQDNSVLREAVKVLLGDPKACATAYAQASSKCMRCGRDLTVPASQNAGLGPECAKKVQW